MSQLHIVGQVSILIKNKIQKIQKLKAFRSYACTTHDTLPIFPRRDDMQAALVLARSGLRKKDLGRLWTLADADRDGELSRHEFAVAMHLAACVTTKGKGGPTLPRTLPSCLAARGKRSGSGGGETFGVAGLAGKGGMVMATTTEREGADKGSVSTLGNPEGLSEEGGLEVEKAASNSSSSCSKGGRHLDRRDKKPQGEEEEEEEEEGGLEMLSWEERDALYAMSTLERAGYDVVFMQVCIDIVVPYEWTFWEYVIIRAWVFSLVYCFTLFFFLRGAGGGWGL